MGLATLAVVTMQKDSGIPADAVQNTFAFQTPLGATTAELNAIAAALTTFYNTTTGAGTVAAQLGKSLSTVAGVSTFEFYNLDGHLDGSPHGSPIRTDFWTLGAVAANGLPDEVAICLSFHSAYGTDVEFAGGVRPRARDRGRIYLGPLGTGVMTEDATTNEINVATLTRQIIADSAARLRDDATTTWSQWSRADAILNAVTTGWVDNAFDIQRRRGNAPTARISW